MSVAYLGRKSICVVASTLPARFMMSQAEKLGIEKIIVMNRTLGFSYRVFKDRYPAIKIITAPASLGRQSLFFFVQLVWARLRGYDVVFFHECCLPLLDLLLMLVKPRGFYFPQVTMGGFEEIQIEEFPQRKIISLIRVLGLEKRFRFYRCPQIGDGEAEYVISARKYPDSIEVKDVNYAREVVAELAGGEVAGNKILFIAGKSFVPEQVQIKYYLDLIDVARSKGYICYIKDHPNPIYRLNIDTDKATNFDPLTPSELLGGDFRYAVGVSSSSLLAYGDRSISLVKLIDEMTPDAQALCISHFASTLPGNGIKYIASISEFEELL